MKRAFVFGHWTLTLLLAPFTAQAIQYIWGTNPNQVVGILEVYPITLLFSIAFSLPTFLFYLACFHLLSKHNINFAISKFILITVAVFGICITQTIIKGSMSQDIIIAYSVTTIIIGLILRIRNKKINNQDSRFAYDKL